MSGIVDLLLSSNEPSIRLNANLRLLSEDPRSDKILKLQEEVRSSARVKALLSERKKDGTIPWHPYAKWDGAHWVLAVLADIGYPQNDEPLIPLREQVYKWLLSKEHVEHTEARPYQHHPAKSQLNQIKERPRIHASMEGNAIWYLLSLNLFDNKATALVQRLLRTQWPDGGWNCDGDPRALKSSFMESLLPFRALALHSRLKNSSSSRSAAKRAAEVFLKRRLYKSARSGAIIDHKFTQLHYPCFWHYDILFGLKVLAETGFIRDDRCEDALDLLETKRLKNGGFPAEAKYYRVTKSRGGRSLVNWGPVKANVFNEFVTVETLYVLKAAGRWEP